MANYLVIDLPNVQALYAQVSAEFLAALNETVYPALRTDPTNQTGRYPIQFERGLGYLYTIELPGGGRYLLRYEVVEDERVVMVRDLITTREP